jgi:hypothetical protein
MASAVTVIVKPVAGGGDWATTLIAVVGLVLAVGSLIWQAASFRLSGSRVSVDIGEGARHVSGTAVVSAPGPALRNQMQAMVAQGFTDPVLAVEVRNRGRSPTNVLAVAVAFDNGASYSSTTFEPPLPFRLEAESEETWYFNRAEVLAAAVAMGQALSSGGLVRYAAAP